MRIFNQSNKFASNAQEKNSSFKQNWNAARFCRLLVYVDLYALMKYRDVAKQKSGFGIR